MVASQPPETGRLVANHYKKFPSFPGWDRKVGQVALPWVCIQQAILGDKYGNGPFSTGTVSFRRGRSGCAVRFD